MKILIVGGGAREHALGWKLAQNPTIELLAAPGNPGLADLGRCAAIAAEDSAGIAAFAAAERPDLVVVGPEGCS